MYKKVLMTVLMLAAVLCVTACGGDTTTTATTMHLKRTEGTVTVSDSAEKDVPLLENLGLYSGYGVDTRSESYAWINLDDVKLTKMDQESGIAIQKEGKNLEIEIKSGSLFFNVIQPLADDETMDIRTSTMVVGIRGTCGWMEHRDGISRVYLLEGTVECSAGGQTVQVNAGEMAEFTANGNLVVKAFTVREILTFVQAELMQDPDLCSDIYDASGLEVQSLDGTEGSEGEDSQSVKEADEKASISYIFSHMPVAAYEVTGLGVGRFESVYEGEFYSEEYDGYFSGPLVRLTPGENTFVLFCIPGDVDTVWTESIWGDGWYSNIGAAIHSPSGSSQWEAITYTCSDGIIPDVEGFSKFMREDTSDYYVYNEETYDGRIFSLVDPWLKWIRFAEIYHPDAQQDDSIYAIEVEAYPESEDYEEVYDVLARMINAFEDLGATAVKEIPVEEALKRCNAVVSEGGAN